MSLKCAPPAETAPPGKGRSDRGSSPERTLARIVHTTVQKKCTPAPIAAAACVHGVPQLELGARTDVVCALGKQAGILLLLRAMNVQWIAVDEITAPDDLEAMQNCSYCGVKLLATAHASGADELYKRPLYKRLMDMRLFTRLLVLTADKRWHTEGVE